MRGWNEPRIVTQQRTIMEQAVANPIGERCHCTTQQQQVDLGLI